MLLEFSRAKPAASSGLYEQRCEGFVLPKRSEIERVSRKLFQLLTETPVTKKTSTNFFETANELSRMVLTPVLPFIRGKRLLVVSDGALQYIPFAALPVSTERAYVPLVRDHEIVNLPSAGILLTLRSRQTNRSLPQKAVAILADPVFSSSDFRVNTSSRNSKRMGSAEFSSNSRIQRALRETGFNENPLVIPRLPFSR